MPEGKISTIAGMGVGIVKFILTKDFLAAVILAGCTGAAAWAGQQLMKFVWHEAKYRWHRKFKKQKQST